MTAPSAAPPAATETRPPDGALDAYRASPLERARTADLWRLIPANRASVLDIGARDGHFSRLLAERFARVTALDLERPTFEAPGIETVAGDVTRLAFPDGAFDCVFCAEVLEHVPDVARACREIVRVARHEIVIGVPYRQDIRLYRTRCAQCGRTNPPWGHVNTFDEKRLHVLFAGCELAATSFVGKTRAVTNAASAWLMDLAGNPWGTYDQDEPCVHCGATLVPPGARSLPQKVASGIGVRLERLQQRFTRPHGNWIHVLFRKTHAQ